MWHRTSCCSAALPPCQGQGLLPSCWNRGPQLCFWAVLLIWGESYPGLEHSTGREATEYLSSGAIYQYVFSVVSLFTIVWTFIVGNSLGPTLTMGMLVIGPGVCQVFSPGHHRATEIRCWDCSNHGSETLWVLWGSWDSGLAKHPYIWAHKPIAAKARPVLAMRELVICSVILLVLCLQNNL